jgi:hypothetical protein
MGNHGREIRIEIQIRPMVKVEDNADQVLAAL